jgi:hypothetical protein
MVVEGKGSFGIVFSSPRIPTKEENFEDVIKLNQVSKILYNIIGNKYYPEEKENFIKTYDNVVKLIEEYPNIFNDENFILPIKAGYINKNDLVLKYNNNEFGLGFDWISKSKNNLNILNQLIRHKDDIYQVVYEKGTPIKYNFDTFLIKMTDICDLLFLCDKNGFYFDDLKYHNLIVHNDKIKIIDFEEPINLNLPETEYTKMIDESKFYNIMYYAYDTISDLLLLEFTDNISRLCHYQTQNYYKILETNINKYIKNVEYKLDIYNFLTNLWKKHINDYTVSVEAFDLELFGMKEIDTLDINYHFESNNHEKMILDSKKRIKIDIDTFIESISLIHVCFIVKDINSSSNDISKLIDSVNKIFALNKKFIKLTQKNNKDILSYLLSNINIYSYGFTYLSWLKINMDNETKNISLEKRDLMLKKIIDIIINCCINFVIIDKKIYLLDRNYENLKKILKK